jgi:hypothetical protein
LTTGGSFIDSKDYYTVDLINKLMGVSDLSRRFFDFKKTLVDPAVGTMDYRFY